MKCKQRRRTGDGRKIMTKDYTILCVSWVKRAQTKRNLYRLMLYFIFSNRIYIILHTFLFQSRDCFISYINNLVNELQVCYSFFSFLFCLKFIWYCILDEQRNNGRSDGTVQHIDHCFIIAFKRTDYK